jgi:tetratricopeptide (TPR) repeat protein
VLALNNLGYNLADQGRKLAEAEEMVRRAVELDRDERARAGIAQAESAAYLDSLGWVLFRKGNLAEAREYLAKAADLSDGAADPTVWDHLGDVCFRLGEKAKAKEAWGKAAGLYENSHQGRQLGRLDEVRRKLKLAEAR